MVLKTLTILCAMTGGAASSAQQLSGTETVATTIPAEEGRARISIVRIANLRRMRRRAGWR
jgi:hypothetical protein